MKLLVQLQVEFINIFASTIKNTWERLKSNDQVDWNLLLRYSIPSLLALQQVYPRFSFSFSFSVAPSTLRFHPYPAFLSL